jgi:glutaredoxin
MYLARQLAAAGALTLVALAAAGPGDASAQQIYKIVGPDGRVTFSDRPPADPTVKASAASVVSMSNGGTPIASLPFEVRQAASRFPTTLYTAPGCVTCAQGRSMLINRGIPFTERTIATKEDSDALARITGANSVPVLTIGSQQLKGFSDSEWNQFLDAAGYPKTSQLPSSYVPAPPTPLVALDQPRPDAQPQQAAAPTPQQQQQRRQQQPPPEQNQNPAGIQF